MLKSDECLLDQNEFSDDPRMKAIVEKHNDEAKAKKQRKNKVVNFIKKIGSHLKNSIFIITFLTIYFHLSSLRFRISYMVLA